MYASQPRSSLGIFLHASCGTEGGKECRLAVGEREGKWGGGRLLAWNSSSFLVMPGIVSGSCTAVHGVS